MHRRTHDGRRRLRVADGETKQGRRSQREEVWALERKKINDGLKGRRRWNDWREMNNESYEFERKKMKFDNGGSTKLPHFVYAARKN